MTEEDLIEKWEQFADDLGSRFFDEYPKGEAIQHYRMYGYDWTLAQFIAIKDDIETEDYHEMLREEEEQDMIDFEREY